MAGVVASETVRAQTLQVLICLQVSTADRPMLKRGCDLTQDQARELEHLCSRYLVCDQKLSLSG